MSRMRFPIGCECAILLPVRQGGGSRRRYRTAPANAAGRAASRRLTHYVAKRGIYAAGGHGRFGET